MAVCFPLGVSMTVIAGVWRALVTSLIMAAWTAQGELGGHVWEDNNRNGIREAGEPVLTNATIYLQNEAPWITLATNTTDHTGRYTFTGLTSGTYRIFMQASARYNVTMANMGHDEDADSDLVLTYWAPGVGGTDSIPYSMAAITNIDGGFVPLQPAFDIRVQPGHARPGQPLFTTNGAPVPFVYAISNSGDIALSTIYVYDVAVADYTEVLSCPINLAPGQSLTFTSIVIATISHTNIIDAFALPVNNACVDIPGLDPVITSLTAAVMIVSGEGDSDGDLIPNAWEILHQLNPVTSNAPEANTDGDWMTDYEEYLADTQPTNDTSFLPPAYLNHDTLLVTDSSTNRLYDLWWTTNLLNESSGWTLLTPAQTGTGAALAFPFTNPPPDAAWFRTGARVP